MMLDTKDEERKAKEAVERFENALRERCSIIEDYRIPTDTDKIVKTYLCPCGYVHTVKKGDVLILRADTCGI